MTLGFVPCRNTYICTYASAVDIWLHVLVLCNNLIDHDDYGSLMVLRRIGLFLWITDSCWINYVTFNWFSCYSFQGHFPWISFIVHHINNTPVRSDPRASFLENLIIQFEVQIRAKNNLPTVNLFNLLKYQITEWNSVLKPWINAALTKRRWALNEK